MIDNIHHHLNYIELPATNLLAMKGFYGSAFGWEFQDWGNSYVEIRGSGISGGFDASLDGRQPSASGALVIIYSDDLGASEQAIVKAGGVISRLPYGFPGGIRFHFLDPSGNELAVWSQT